MALQPLQFGNRTIDITFFVVLKEYHNFLLVFQCRSMDTLYILITVIKISVRLVVYKMHYSIGTEMFGTSTKNSSSTNMSQLAYSNTARLSTHVKKGCHHSWEEFASRRSRERAAYHRVVYFSYTLHTRTLKLHAPNIHTYTRTATHMLLVHTIFTLYTEKTFRFLAASYASTISNVVHPSFN